VVALHHGRLGLEVVLDAERLGLNVALHAGRQLVVALVLRLSFTLEDLVLRLLQCLPSQESTSPWNTCSLHPLVVSVH